VKTQRSAIAFAACALVLAACAPATAAPTAAAVATLPPPQATATFEPVQLKLGVLNFMSHAPLYIAHSAGLFAEQGLEVELVDFGSLNNELQVALLAGQVDVAGLSLGAATINAVLQGSNTKAVADKVFTDADAPCADSGFVVQPGTLASGALAERSGLKGMSISFSGGSVQQRHTDILLESAGLTYDDVEVVDIRDYASRVEALRSGTVDVAALTEPWTTRAIRDGIGEMWVSSADLTPDAAGAFVFYGPSMLEKDVDVGVRFITAYLNAVGLYNQGKTDENVRLLSEVTGLDAEELRQMCWPSFHPEGKINFDSVMEFQDWALAEGLIDGVVPIETLWDGRYIEEANARIGK
jgi:NitT/TauT family transport system substrate-binding protein